MNSAVLLVPVLQRTFEEMNMHVVIILGLTIFAIGSVLVSLDRHWYKRHPGAGEKLAQIDNELTREGL